MDEYAEYNALTEYQKNCLVPTNFWRIIEEKDLIKVPEANKKYWDRWHGDKNEERAKKILEKRNKLKLCKGL